MKSKLKEIARSKGLNQLEIAKQCNLTPGTVSVWWHQDLIRVDTTVLKALSNGLNVAPTEIIDVNRVLQD